MASKKKVEETKTPEVGSISAEVTTPERKSEVTAALSKPEQDKAIKIVTTAQVLAEFEEPLSKEERKLVNSTIQSIADDMRAMVTSALSIGTKLAKLRDSLGSDRFAVFARNVLPTLGLPESTAWKYMGRASVAHHWVINPVARQYLFRLPQADQMFQSDSASIKDAVKNIFKEHPVPKDGTPAAECEAWALRVTKAIGTKVAEERKKSAQAPDPEKLKESALNAFDRILEKSTFDTFSDTMVRAFEHYLSSEMFAKNDSYQLVAKLDRLHVQRTKLIDSKSKQAEAVSA